MQFNVVHSVHCKYNYTLYRTKIVLFIGVDNFLKFSPILHSSAPFPSSSTITLILLGITHLQNCPPLITQVLNFSDLLT